MISESTFSALAAAVGTLARRFFTERKKEGVSPSWERTGLVARTVFKIVNCRPSRFHGPNTTTRGEFVLDSVRESELARRGRVDLYVIHDIAIEEDGDVAKAVGGIMKVVQDWGRKNLTTRSLGFAVGLSRPDRSCTYSAAATC